MATGEVFAEELAPAKVNLTLHVTGRRGDGYHLLDSLVVFADFGDLIRVRVARGGVTLRVTGPTAGAVPPGESNLVMRAARLAGAEGVEITLEKHLPAAAGLGGGSSDAAATLRALRRIHGRPEPDPAVPDPAVPDPALLGADVPVCLQAVSARMSGIGDEVVPVTGIPPLPAVLVNPGVALRTPDVFAALERRDRAPMPELPAFGGVADCAAWLAGQRNDLQEAAVGLVPVIGQVLAVLHGSGAALARMSGSGATCFGLFSDMEDARLAARRIAAAEPGWWVRAVTLATD